jgi:cbb3-type cytochrome oxidase maturation protein
MEILLLLIPMSVVLALLVIAVFAWALNGGQFDDIEAEGERILCDEVPAGGLLFDADQHRLPAQPEQ